MSSFFLDPIWVQKKLIQAKLSSKKEVKEMLIGLLNYSIKFESGRKNALLFSDTTPLHKPKINFNFLFKTIMGKLEKK